MASCLFDSREERSKQLEALIQHIQERYPVFDFTVNSEDIENGASVVFNHFFPNWDKTKMHLHQFTDGITNKLFKVVANLEDTPREGPQQKTALVRVYGEKTEVMINRESELRTLICLAKKGICSPLYGRFNNGICYGYVEGIPFVPEDMKAEGKYRQVACQLALFHTVDTFGERSPSLFTTLRKWLDEIPQSFDDPCKEKQFKEQFSIEKCRGELEFLESNLENTESDVVFCHNDLLCANILYQPPTETGHVRGKVAFIDYEYGSYNWRAYDIANHFCEMMGYNVDPSLFPSQEFQFKWIRAYLAAQRKIQKGDPNPQDDIDNEEGVSDEEVKQLYEQVRKFSPAPSFHWGVWALVQARYSSLESFDYLAYSAKLFNRYYQRKEEVYGAGRKKQE